MEKTHFNGWWLPIDISTHGSAVDKLIDITHWFMAVLFAGWLIYFIYCLIRFRESSNPKAAIKVPHFKIPTYLEVGIVLVEAVLLVFISSPLWAKVKKDFPTEEQNPMKVRILAEQFAWNIHYPGKDGKFGRTKIELIDGGTNPLGIDREDPDAKDDVFTINELIVPVDRPVVAQLSSKDVIHSFSVNVMRVKQDAIPGMEIPIWFQAKETGSFDISCAQLCGNGHYRMRGMFLVKSPEEFQTWLDEQHKAVLEEQGLPVEGAPAKTR